MPFEKCNCPESLDSTRTRPSCGCTRAVLRGRKSARCRTSRARPSPWTSTTGRDHACMMVTVRVADFGRAAPPSRGGRCFSARRRRKFCEGRGQNGHFPLEKPGGRKNSTEELHPATSAALLPMLLFLCSCSCASLGCSSCTADALAALLPHTQQREACAAQRAVSNSFDVHRRRRT